jgi:hypothetical protein
MAEEDNQSLHNENHEKNRVRTLRDHMNPTRKKLKKNKAFLKHKNKHVLIRKFNPTLNEETLSSPIFCPI